MSWSFLTDQLNELSSRSTVISKLWLPLVIILRGLVIKFGAEPIYADDKSPFEYNTTQVGCEMMCSNAFEPISCLRFWLAQWICILMPSVLYHSYAMHKFSHMPQVDEREREDWASEKLCEKHEGRLRIKCDGLMIVYVVQLAAQAFIEFIFLCGQCTLFGLEEPEIYTCTVPGCKDPVSCFVSRPIEKIIVLVIMYALSTLCLLQNMLEITYLVKVRDLEVRTRPKVDLSIQV